MPAGLLILRVLELRDGIGTDEREELGARVDAAHDVGARPEAAEDLVGGGSIGEGSDGGLRPTFQRRRSPPHATEFQSGEL